MYSRSNPANKMAHKTHTSCARLFAGCGTNAITSSLLSSSLGVPFFFVDIIPITMAAPPPQNFPYDYLFKVLIIGDASVGKVGTAPVRRLPFSRAVSHEPVSRTCCRWSKTTTNVCLLSLSLTDIPLLFHPIK